jgi:GntR family transcriptional regulator
VRQALGELELDGRLRKEKGRGTFVAEPRSSSWFLQSSHGFHDEATRAGRTVTSKVLRNAVEPLPRWATDALDLPPGAEGVILERLRYVDGELVMYVESHLRAGLAEAIDEQQLATGSLYEALRSRFGVEVAGGRRVVDATAARKRIAGLLEVEEGAPLLFVEAVSWDSDLRPFECYRAWHRSDRTRINVHVVSERAAATAGVDATTLRLSRSAGR